MKAKTHRFERKMLPPEGVSVSLSKGNTLQRVHLDLGEDGITLAMVGAATASLSKENRQVITLKPGKEGVSLAMVGAALADIF